MTLKKSISEMEKEIRSMLGISERERIRTFEINEEGTKPTHFDVTITNSSIIRHNLEELEENGYKIEKIKPTSNGFRIDVLGEN